MDATSIIARQPLLANRFEVLRVLGEGAAGSVLQVKDRQRGYEEVALKVLQNSSAFDEHTIERFKAEIKLLREIKHPHIVAAYDFIVLGSTIAYTMEYVRGQDLGRIMQARPVSHPEIDLIFDQLLGALGELHERGVYHRDLKLENILFSLEQGVKLSDFGLMKQEELPGLTRTGILLGTAQYMPPEYIRSSMFDGRSDIYCAGIVLYELLTRSRFLHDRSGNDAIQYLLQTGFQVPLNLPSGTPERYVAILKTAMAPRPEDRFQTAQEMAAALADTGWSPDRKRKRGAPRSPPKPSRIRSSLMLLLSDPLVIALEITLLVLVGLIAMQSPSMKNTELPWRGLEYLRKENDAPRKDGSKQVDQNHPSNSRREPSNLR